MSPTTLYRALLVGSLAVLLSACGGGRGSSAAAPTGGIAVTPGDGQVVVTWTPDADVEYWLWYAAGTSMVLSYPNTTPGHQTVLNVSSPYVLTGLKNGETYSFTVNGRYGGGPGGAAAPTVTVLPRRAGETWSAGAGMTGGAALRGVSWGLASGVGNQYLAVGAAGALFKSSDGVTSAGLNWSAVSGSGISANLNATIYSLGKYVVAGDGGAIYSSADLTTWTAATSNTAQKLNALASNGSRLVAVGDQGTIVYSGDGSTWSAATAVPAGNPNLYGVSYLSPGVWLALGQNCTAWSSTDGASWSALSVAACTAGDLYGAAYRPATSVTIITPSTSTTTTAASYVLVGTGGLILSSPDQGIGNWNWSAVSGAPTSEDLYAVLSYPSQFLAVGANGAVVSSPDGLTWTARTSGTTSALYGLTNAQGQYVAVGAGATSLYSR